LVVGLVVKKPRAVVVRVAGSDFSNVLLIMRCVGPG
jgi:hypothetical protein